TTLLLLRSGYAYVPYSSLESVIENTKDGYYLALRRTQGTIRSDAPGDANEITDGGFVEPFPLLCEQGDAVPLRIGRPCFAFAAIVVGGNRDVSDGLGGVDPAEPSDDVKFDDVLHGLSPDRVRRNVLTDILGAALRLRASQKTEAPFMETVGEKPVFCLRA
ncbi:MAG: hypothetical protein ABIT16_08455, partial [Croceibacterium sp.]